MKKSIIVKFIINLLAYALIVFLLYFLYSPKNPSDSNKTGSTTEFVYQQF